MTAVTTMVRADLKRAKDILKLLDEARTKAYEVRHLLEQAASLASNDSYQDVSRYDAQDIRDIGAVVKIGITVPLNQRSSRWCDIVHGREETVRMNSRGEPV